MKNTNLKFVIKNALIVFAQFTMLMVSALVGVEVLREFIRNEFSLSVIYGLGFALLILAIIFLIGSEKL